MADAERERLRKARAAEAAAEAAKAAKAEEARRQEQRKRDWERRMGEARLAAVQRQKAATAVKLASSQQEVFSRRWAKAGEDEKRSA